MFRQSIVTLMSSTGGPARYPSSSFFISPTTGGFIVFPVLDVRKLKCPSRYAIRGSLRMPVTTSTGKPADK